MDLQFRKGNEQDRQAVADLLHESQMEPEVDPGEFLLAIRGEKLAGAIRVERKTSAVYPSGGGLPVIREPVLGGRWCRSWQKHTRCCMWSPGVLQLDFTGK